MVRGQGCGWHGWGPHRTLLLWTRCPSAPLADLALVSGQKGAPLLGFSSSPLRQVTPLSVPLTRWLGHSCDSGTFPRGGCGWADPKWFLSSAKASCWINILLLICCLLVFNFYKSLSQTDHIYQEQDLRCSQKMTVLQLFYASEIKGESKKDYMRMGKSKTGIGLQNR